jgi:hypothetical protein
LPERIFHLIIFCEIGLSVFAILFGLFIENTLKCVPPVISTHRDLRELVGFLFENQAWRQAKSVVKSLVERKNERKKGRVGERERE